MGLFELSLCVCVCVRACVRVCVCWIAFAMFSVIYLCDGVGGGFFKTALILFSTNSDSAASIVVCLCEIELFVILKCLILLKNYKINLLFYMQMKTIA